MTEFAADWFRAKSAVWAPNTLRNREDDFTRRIEPAIGGVELTALTREVTGSIPVLPIVSPEGRRRGWLPAVEAVMLLTVEPTSLH